MPFATACMNLEGITTMKFKALAPWKKCCDKPRQLVEKQRHYFANEGLYSQSYGFSSCHARMWELDSKKGWVLKNCFWTVVLEKTESPLDCMEIKPVNPKGKQPWIVTGRTHAEAPILWPLDAKSQLSGKDLDSGKDWGQEEKGMRWDGWMALLTQWTWIWANSRRWWTGKPGVL